MKIRNCEMENFTVKAGNFLKIICECKEKESAQKAAKI
jgi:hypothetical protein